MRSKTSRAPNESSIFRQPLLRNVFFASLLIATGLPLSYLFFLHPSFTKVLIEDKKEDSISIARHLSSLITSEGTELKQDSLPVNVLSQLVKHENDFGLTKLKVYSRSGQVIFSTDGKEIGSINKGKYFQEILTKGKAYAVYARKHSKSLEDERLRADLVETYVPLMRDGMFAGAFEIYYDITPRQEQLDNLLLHSVVVLTGLAVGLFIIIAGALIRGNKTLVERQRAEEQLKWESSVNATLSELYGPLVSPFSTLENITNIVLDEAKGLTGSEQGLVSSIDPITGDHIGHTLTKMMGNKCKVSRKDQGIVSPPGEDGFYNGLWGYSLNTQEPFFTNSPQTHQASVGIPKGHIPLENFLAAPVMLGTELVGQIALANKGEDYTEQDLEAIRRVAEFYALAIQRNRAQEALRKRERDLGERVKELNCLYGISHLVEKPNISLEEVLQGTIDLIPPSWQYPEIACARLIVMDHVLTTNSFKETAWKQTREIVVNGEEIGSLQVFYLEQRPKCDEGPFLKEERSLINSIAGLLGRIIERIQAQEALQKANDELESRVEKRTAELALSNKQLQREIAERKRAEKQIRKSKEMLQSVFDGISEPLIMLDNNMSIIMLNKAALEYYQVPSTEDVIARACYKAIKGSSSPCDGCPVPGHLSAGSQVSFERKGFFDSTRLEQVVVYPVHEVLGGIGSCILRISDITEKRRVERQMIRADRLSSLGQLSGGIAHEIRNPLSGIGLFMDVLFDEERFERKHEELEIYREIKGNISKINTIIKRILDFARDSETVAAKIEVNPLIKEGLKLWYGKMRKNEIKLELSLEENLPTVFGDAIGFQQVVNNLVQNAIEAMNGGGRLRIATRNGISSFYVNRPMVTIEVQDTGPGIAPEQQEKIFDPFFSTKPTGTGLGLAISHKIVESHGGILFFKTQPGQGTTFILELPVISEG